MAEQPRLRDIIAAVKCRFCPMLFLDELDRADHERGHTQSGAGTYVKCYNCRLKPTCNLYATYRDLDGAQKDRYRENVIQPCALYSPINE
ncbi:MAG: hypothetical protein JRN62_04200 [Nitrososphaerota archaeon]|jgi:hypothetical protein|nr:hypothetical protein [Nitrososphaerota archaeon]MDG6948805.1 hypothetical protein [Nitrososphaerota archaeon]